MTGSFLSLLFLSFIYLISVLLLLFLLLIVALDFSKPVLSKEMYPVLQSVPVLESQQVVWF